MTLLISGVTKNYAISTADMRITSIHNGKLVTHDEKFNKHIIFNSEGFKANITYTGVAKWHYSGKEYLIYDIISDSIANSIKNKSTFSELLLNLINDIWASLNSAKLSYKQIELHIVGGHSDIPYPFMICISNFTNVKPWSKTSPYEWSYNIKDFYIFIKFADEPDYMIGGVHNIVNNHEKLKLTKIFNSNSDGFNISNLSAKIIHLSAKRSELIGSRSVTTIIPLNGFIDFNLWDKTESGIIGYMPRMVLINGNTIGPSEFPVELQLLLKGYIPPENIFFRSIIYLTMKRSIRRKIFRYKKGDKVPGILGLLSIALYGEVPKGYVNLFS